MASRRPRRHSTLGYITARGQRFAAYYEHAGATHRPGRTFTTRELADGWLRDEQRLIDRGEWTPPAQRRAQAEAEQQRDELTLGEYATKWVAGRQVRGRAIRPRTAEGYRLLLASPRWLKPLAKMPLVDLDRATVSSWYRKLPADKATMRQHAYALLRSILKSAVDDGIIPVNPANIHGATSHPRPQHVEILTAQQVGQLADAMPPQHRMMVLLAAWCGLRFGELCALRRSDIATTGDRTVIHVRRAVVTVGHKRIEGPVKSDAGVRDVVVPPHIVKDLREHIKRDAQWGRDGLLFPPTSPTSDFLTPGQFYGHLPVTRKGKVVDPGGGYYLARHTLGRDDLNFHRLRHFAATSLAIAGATNKELLAAMGHSSLQVAARYQEAGRDRMATLAERMSDLAKAESGQA